MKLNNKQKETLKAMKEDVIMLFIIPKDLKMAKGKIASQVGHGSIGLYKQIIKDKKYSELLNLWENNGSKKVVLKCKNEGEMNKLNSQLTNINILTHCVYDAGKTQVKSGSFTVLCIFGKHKQINQYTNNLQLV